MLTPIRVAVTGAGGQIGYALIFRLASGGLFGPTQPLSLSLLEITPALPALHGTMMELDDCAFPLLADLKSSDSPEQAFADADWVILVGGLPRKEGMSGRLDSRQRTDFHRSRQSDQRRRRRRRPRLDRCQPVQHELSHRSFARAEGRERSLVRDDSARSESRGVAARGEGGSAGRASIEDDDLGKS